MNCRLQDEVQSMCEGAEAWCAGNRKFWAAAVGQKQSVESILGIWGDSLDRRMLQSL